MTAPVSAGSVSTRIADSSAAGSCSGRQIRSKYLRHRPERVVDGDVAGVRQLELLQQRRGAAVGEGVGRQQQHRQPVDGGQRGAGDHVGGARADAAGDRVGLQPVLHPGVRDRGVHHGLLVAAQHVRQRARARRARPAAAPGRCRPRCRGRRCRSSRRRASARPRRTREYCAPRNFTSRLGDGQVARCSCQ